MVIVWREVGGRKGESGCSACRCGGVTTRVDGWKTQEERKVRVRGHSRKSRETQSLSGDDGRCVA